MAFISFPKGIPNHPTNKNVILRIMSAPSSKPGAEPQNFHSQELVKLFGGYVELVLMVRVGLSRRGKEPVNVLVRVRLQLSLARCDELWL